MATVHEARAHRIREPVPMSATLAINAEVARLRAAGEKVFHLGFGEARYPGHPKVLDALRRHADVRNYPPVAGLPELREAVAGHYRDRLGVDAEPSRVLVGAGSKSLLFAAFHAVDGDVLLPTPCWVSYETQIGMTGNRAIPVPTRAADAYLLTPEALRRSLDEARAAGASPSAVLLNSPGNPTGTMYPAELLERLAAVARDERLLVLSDEIYALTAFGEVPHTSMARLHPEGTLVTSGLSKHLSLGGWRLGVAVLPTGEAGERLRRCMTGVAASIWTSATAPVQHAATVAYGGDPDIDAYVAACAVLQGRVTLHLHRVLEGLGVPCPRPSGGFYLYPDLAPWRGTLRARHRVRTSRELAGLLLTECRIASSPGSDFGAGPEALTLRFSTSFLHDLADATVERVLELAAQPASETLLRRFCPDVLEVAERFATFIGRLGDRSTETAGDRENR